MPSTETARFASFDLVEADDIEGFGLLTGPATALPRGAYLRLEGHPNPEVYRLRSGWLVCSVGTASGGRQITKIHLPGDLVGMSSLASHTAAETIQALTEAEVVSIPLDVFSRVFRERPRLAAMLFMWAQEESVRLMHQLTLLGRVRAPRRVAAFLLALSERYWLTFDEPGDSFQVPLTQQDLADATGMSIVHANRSIRELRNRGIAIWQNGTLTIPDRARLADFANAPSVSRRSTRWI